MHLLACYTGYAVVGIVAGLLAGLIIVPALCYLFELQGISPEATLHLAIGTSLGTIVFTSLSSAGAHHRRGAVDLGIVMRISPGILAGTYLGGLLASRMVTHTLKVVFAGFLLLVAAQMLSGAKPQPTRVFPKMVGATAVGTAIGTVSGLVGIGGGSMSVPFMLWCNVDTRRAVGTSAAIGLPIAVSGALSYAINGMRSPLHLPHTWGYLHWPALFGVAVLSVATAPLGAQLAFRVAPAKIKRYFALLLIAMSAKMLMGALR
jgi:uncharacterized membrane protein YfcA